MFLIGGGTNPKYVSTKAILWDDSIYQLNKVNKNI